MKRTHLASPYNLLPHFFNKANQQRALRAMGLDLNMHILINSNNFNVGL
jgi:hypothetical protein